MKGILHIYNDLQLIGTKYEAVWAESRTQSTICILDGLCGFGLRPLRGPGWGLTG